MQKFYAQLVKTDKDKQGKVYCKIRVLTPFNEERQPYLIKIPLVNAQRIFQYVPRDNDIFKKYKDDPRIKKLEGSENIKSGVLVVRDNIIFRSLEVRLYGEEDPFNLSDESSVDESENKSDESDEFKII